MHQEMCKKDKISIVKITFVILASAALLIGFNWATRALSKDQFGSFIDIITLFFASCIAYGIMIQYIMAYKYIVIEEDFIIQEVTGTKEKLLLNINLNQIISFKPVDNKDYDKDRNKKYRSKRKLTKGLKDKKIYYVIYEENNEVYYIEIEPSKELISIIKNRVLAV